MTWLPATTALGPDLEIESSGRLMTTRVVAESARPKVSVTLREKLNTPVLEGAVKVGLAAL